MFRQVCTVPCRFPTRLNIRFHPHPPVRVCHRRVNVLCSRMTTSTWTGTMWTRATCRSCCTRTRSTTRRPRRCTVPTWRYDHFRLSSCAQRSGESRLPWGPGLVMITGDKGSLRKLADGKGSFSLPKDCVRVCCVLVCVFTTPVLFADHRARRGHSASDW